VQAYTQARLKDCLLKTDFAKVMRSPNAHIYLKILRENIMDELKLTQSATTGEFDWHKTPESRVAFNMVHHPESKYNLHHLNNEDAIGYRNLEERAADIANNKNLAHETVFDKMLADYFLQKRGDYKKGNQLLTDLERIFSSDSVRSGGKAADYVNAEKQGKRAGDPTGEDTLGRLYLEQTMEKEDQPALEPYNFTALMDLDIAVNRQLHHGKGGISNELK